jgi:hypothetical protein
MMPSKTFQVPTAVGDEDLMRVENILRQTNGVTRVEMHPEIKEITVEWDSPATWHDIHRNLTDLGYVPEEQPAP